MTTPCARKLLRRTVVPLVSGSVISAAALPPLPCPCHADPGFPEQP